MPPGGDRVMNIYTAIFSLPCYFIPMHEIYDIMYHMETIETNTQKKVSFITLGCKVNQYDSDAMRTLFVRNGYAQAGENDDADVYVVNTCSVTSIGDRKSRQMVRRIRRAHPKAIIAVAGCYAQLAPEIFERWET